MERSTETEADRGLVGEVVVELVVSDLVVVVGGGCRRRVQTRDRHIVDR